MQIKKMLYLIIGILIFISSIFFGFLLKNDYKNYEIDKYNFEQLEKAKIILDQISKDDQKVFKLKDLNLIYKAGIEPIKNCYYVSSNNGKYPYIFGFKLESIIYKMRYLKIYYAYPKYDLPIHYTCIGGKECDYDSNKGVFKMLTGRPCSD